VVSDTGSVRHQWKQRLHLLNAWREAPFYSDRERAALEWTETLTLVSENQACLTPRAPK